MWNMRMSVDFPTRTTRRDLEAEVAAVLVKQIETGCRHSSYRRMTSKSPQIWVEATGGDSVPCYWRITGETGLVNIADYYTTRPMTEAEALRAVLRCVPITGLIGGMNMKESKCS
jgi:hypothetical protein